MNNPLQLFKSLTTGTNFFTLDHDSIEYKKDIDRITFSIGSLGSTEINILQRNGFQFSIFADSKLQLRVIMRWEES